MKITSLAAASLIALSSFGALAATTATTTTNLGTQSADGRIYSFGESVTKNTAFDDFFKFVLPENSGVTISITDLLGKVGVVSSVSLYENNKHPGTLGGIEDTLVGSFVGGNNGQFTFSQGALAAGKYFIEVIGLSGKKDTLIGGISVAAVPAVTAVPEPESFAMLLAGLGLMGAIAVRRNKKLPN